MRVNNNTTSYNPSFKGIQKYIVKQKDQLAFTYGVLLPLKLKDKVLPVIENPTYSEFEDIWRKNVPHPEWVQQNLKNLGIEIKPPKLLDPKEKISVYLFSGKDFTKYLKKFATHSAIKNELKTSRMDRLQTTDKFPVSIYGASSFAKERRNAFYMFTHNERHQREFDKFLKHKKVDTIEFNPFGKVK